MLWETFRAEQGCVQSLEATMVFQCFTAGFAETVEVRLLSVTARGEILVERAQQALAGMRGCAPIDQVERLEAL